MQTGAVPGCSPALQERRSAALQGSKPCHTEARSRLAGCRAKEYLVTSSRVARGKAELADDIRVLDGQRFLAVLPLTHSVASEELAIAESQPNVLNSASSMACVSELIFVCSFITSPYSGAPSRPVPPFGSSFGRLPTVARVIV